MSKYLIGKNTAITLGEGNTISPDELENGLMAALGYEPQVADGVTVWQKEQERFWLINQAELPAEEEKRNEAIAAIAEKTGAQPITPAQDHSFAQELMRHVPMQIAGDVFQQGSLHGQWRAETISRYAPYNIQQNGILTGRLQPISVSHPSLPLAVCLLFLRSLGVTQRAYVVIPEAEGAEPQLVFVTEENEVLLKQAMPETSLFRMDSLDKYAVVGLEQDLVKEAIEKAQLQRTIRLAEVKAKAQEPDPEPELVEPSQDESALKETAPHETDTEA